MSFIPDMTKETQDNIFSRKTTYAIHIKIFFSIIWVGEPDSQKQLGLHLDSKNFFDINNFNYSE